MPTANWSDISHGGRIIHDIIHINTYIKQISFITEGLPWKITVNKLTIGVYRRKTTGTTFPLYKKERERRSRAFPSDSNPDCTVKGRPKCGCRLIILHIVKRLCFVDVHLLSKRLSE